MEDPKRFAVAHICVARQEDAIRSRIMREAVRQAQLALPTAIDRTTRQPMTLDRALREPDAVADTESLSDQERAALVRARWEAGAWSDVFYCDQFVDLRRAVAELEAGTVMGTDLRDITERAIQMVLEDLEDLEGLEGPELEDPGPDAKGGA